MFYEIVEKAFALERAGHRIVRLHIGDTNLPTPECATRTATAVLARGHSTYGPGAGLAVLRERIAQREGCDVANVVVGPGSKQILYALLSVLGAPGDRVGIPTPAWPAYELAAKQLRMTPVPLASRIEDDWAFNPESARGCRVAFLCNPLNPTSTVYAPDLIARTRDVVREGGGHLIVDEAYRGLAFEELPRPEGVIRVRSFSKEFNMEGWRLGYAIAPVEVARELVRFNQITTTCVPDFVQEAGAACLENEAEILGAHRAIWRERSLAAQQALEAAGFRFARPQAAMYVFATHERLQDSGEFALRLLDRGVGVAPGSGFGAFPRFLRICVNQEPAVMREAIAAIGAALT